MKKVRWRDVLGSTLVLFALGGLHVSYQALAGAEVLRAAFAAAFGLSLLWSGTELLRDRVAE